MCHFMSHDNPKKTPIEDTHTKKRKESKPITTKISESQRETAREERGTISQSEKDKYQTISLICEKKTSTDGQNRNIDMNTWNRLKAVMGRGRLDERR